MQLSKDYIISMYRKVPVSLLWFSASGNSLVIAIEIKNCINKMGCKVNLLPLDKTNPAEININSIIGLVIPVAGQSTYPFIWEFIEDLPETSNKSLFFFVDTLGFLFRRHTWPR